MSQVLVLNGNPKNNSLCKGLAEAYADGVRTTGGDVTVIHIADLNFDSDLKQGYEEIPPLEDDLNFLQSAIKEATHILVLSPVWWGTIPAKLKGLFDRVLLPGFAYKFEKGKAIQKKLLKGKTSRVVVTMDAPGWYYRFLLGDPIIKTLKKTILEFCGIKVKNISRFGPVRSSTDQKKESWFQFMKNAGIKDFKAQF